MAWQMLGWRGQCGGSCHSPWAVPAWLRTCPYLQPCAAPSALHITPGFRGSGLFSLHLGNDGDNLHYWSLQHAHGWKENRKDKHLCVGMSIHTQSALPAVVVTAGCGKWPLCPALLQALCSVGCCSAQGGSASLPELGGCIHTLEFEEAKKMVCHIQNAILH